jgi:hypothetical protein
MDAPTSPVERARASAYERRFRALTGLGDEAERLLAVKLGPERAHVLRTHRGGWPMRWTWPAVSTTTGTPPAAPRTRPGSG